MYECSEKCGYRSNKFFGLCPKCNKGYAEENSSAVIPSKTIGTVKNIPAQITPYEIKRVDKNAKSMDFEKRTKYNGLNEILSTPKGFVSKQICALGASPGVGKSTLCVNISDEETLYISTEESYDQVNSRFLRINAKSKADILCIKDINSIIDAIQKTDKKLIVIDSLNNINNGMDSYMKQAQNASRLTDICKENNKIAIIICQVTRSGEISGMNTILHVVDTVLYLERSAISNNLILTANKNRFGEIGNITMFEHSEQGLVEVSPDYSEYDMTGSTIIDAQFGVKKIPVCIEALVAPASMNYGLRRSNGISQQRVQQILAVLQTNAKQNRLLNFSDKDVYVSVSYGLTINDTNTDLAIANSILSSHFNKVVETNDCLLGELSLNGTIKGNKSRFKHIRDLISLYTTIK